ncbi:MAG: hypothetical protein AB7G21_10880 [Dehalococcoidia bacterium]
MVALGVAAGGFAASSGASHALAAAIAATEVPVATPEPTSLAVAVSAASSASATAYADPAIVVADQPFESSRTTAPVESSATTRGTEDVVRATRLITPSTPTPNLRPGDRVTVTVSFYYCELGADSPHRGDGGGFCGAMRDGSVVYNGAAACDYIYLGQRFRIEGDPLGRIYRCADTGSAVHGLHRDIWFGSSDEGWKWQRSVGQSATIEILP